MKQNFVTAKIVCRIFKPLGWLTAALLLSLFCSFLLDPVQAKDPPKERPRSVQPERLHRLERQEQREYRQRAFPLAEIPHGARQHALDQIQHRG